VEFLIENIRRRKMITINIAKEFAIATGGREKSDGEYSGEQFREEFLEKHFKDSQSKEKITIILDGTYGYSTSFLEEAFGGLARLYGKNEVLERLEFVSEEEPLLIEEIQSYILGAI
jgi:hypothetical protein